MTECPVPRPTEIERHLFERCSPCERPAHEFCYSALRYRHVEEEPVEPHAIDIRDPVRWASWSTNWLAPSVPGEWFAHVLRGCTRVLDVGAGSGRPALYLAGHIPEVVAVEPSPGEMQHAQKVKRDLKLEDVTLMRGDALQLPFEPSSFDGVLFCYSLEATGDIPRALAEANRVLRPGDPVIYYRAMRSDPLSERRYCIWIRPSSALGRTIVEHVTGRRDDIAPADLLLGELTASRTPEVARVICSCVPGIAPTALRAGLEGLGLGDISFWALPSSWAFAKTLEEEGILRGLKQEHLIGYLRALVRASRSPRPVGEYVSARKPN